LARLDRLRSVGEAYRESATKKPPRFNAISAGLKWVGGIGSAAQVLSALALVALGFASYEISQRSFESAEKDVADRTQLSNSIDDLRRQRDSLTQDIADLQRDKQNLSSSMAAAERDLGQSQARIRSLDEVASNAQSKANALVTEKVREAMSTTLVFALSGELAAGSSSMGPRAMVDSWGQPMPHRKPIEFYYPLDADTQWAAILERVREWKATIVPEDSRTVADEMVSKFVAECRPTTSPDEFAFREPFPQFQTFPTSLQWRTSMSVSTQAQLDAWQKELDVRRTREQEANDRATAYAERFNSAKKNYMELVAREIAECRSSPLKGYYRDKEIVVHLGQDRDLFEWMKDIGMFREDDEGTKNN